MSTDASRGGAATGALLLCRAEPDSVAFAAQLLREPMLLAGAGAGEGEGEGTGAGSGVGDTWSVLVPEGRPWRDGGEPVDRVLTGWATALAVGAPWPVLALWWDADRAGYTLASGFRRPVGYVWLANGTPAGEDEAMRTFAARLGLDPVLDVQALDALTEPDPALDATARLRALLAVLTRAGVALPAGLDPGEPADRLRQAAQEQRDTRAVEWPGWREAVRAELDDVDSDGRLSRWRPWAGTPQSRALALAQLAAGLPLTVLGARRHSVGWAAAGALLLAHGALGLAYEVVRPRD
ncbi:hypothetical protein [Streptomyces panaciradicis]|uniref:hypothetical protein n=1 Tax=Streptomyces panaciradicis TaxID=1470261 RepID=UPI00201CFBF5|nr:hypothetical protein [Streptomyces panaciradicis]MCL6672804.1 hypothetical protein [Streptomyces panaciradicis]